MSGWKRRILLALLLLGAVVAFAVTRLMGQAIVESHSGADPRSAFHEIVASPAEILETVQWLPDATWTERELEPSTRKDIADAYAQAWAALDRAAANDSKAPLQLYFSGGALAAAERARAVSPVASTMRHVRHPLRLTFYSDDGSIAAFEDTAATMERIVHGRPRETVSVVRHALRVVMLLEDGNWRVRQLERVG